MEMLAVSSGYLEIEMRLPGCATVIVVSLTWYDEGPDTHKDNWSHVIKRRGSYQKENRSSDVDDTRLINLGLEVDNPC